jgi:hypothetical protein
MNAFTDGPDLGFARQSGLWAEMRTPQSVRDGEKNTKEGSDSKPAFASKAWAVSRREATRGNSAKGVFLSRRGFVALE